MPQPFLFKLREQPTPAKGFAPIIPHRSPGANPLAFTLSDSFLGSSIDNTRWSIGSGYQSSSFVTGGHTVTVSGGDLVLTPAVNYASGSDSGVQCYANAAYDMTQDRFYFSINDLSNMPSNEFISFYLMNAALDAIGFKFQWNGTTTSITYFANASLTSTAFDPVNHGWFCLDWYSATQFRFLIAPPSTTAPARGDAAWVDHVGPWAFPGALTPKAVVPVFQVGSNNAIPSGSTAVVGNVHSINAPTSTGNLWQFISSAAAAWSETSALSRLRGAVSSAAIAWSEASALSNLRGLVSNAAAAWVQSSALNRIRSLAASVVAEAWSETSRIGRLAVLGASAVAEVWSESATITRIRGGISSVAASWSEASNSFGRIRAFVASASEAWSETAIISRLRQFSASSVNAVFAASSALARLRQLVSSQASAFNEASTLSRLRAVVSSVAAKWSELASVAPIKLLSASAVAAAWSETSATVLRLRSWISSVTESWAETSKLSRLRGAVSASGAIWTDGASLSRARVLGPSGAAAAWVEGSGLSRLRGIGSQSASQWAETSVIIRKRLLGSSSVAATWVETSIYGATFHPAVTTPSSRRDIGTITARRIDGSEPSRRVAPNLQPRRATH